MNFAPLLFPDLDPPPAYNTGVLPSQLIRMAARVGLVTSPALPIEEDQVQPASLDLRLGEFAYRLPYSFLPGPKATVGERLDSLSAPAIELTNGTLLERYCVYLVPLLEHLNLPSKYDAFASPKSSTGRLDIFTRLIVDYSTAFDSISSGYKGGLYLEICPQSFSIFVRTGYRLSQLRFRRGSPRPSAAALQRAHDVQPILYDNTPNGSVALSGGP